MICLSFISGIRAPSSSARAPTIREREWCLPASRGSPSASCAGNSFPIFFFVIFLLSFHLQTLGLVLYFFFLWTRRWFSRKLNQRRWWSWENSPQTCCGTCLPQTASPCLMPWVRQHFHFSYLKHSHEWNHAFRWSRYFDIKFNESSLIIKLLFQYRTFGTLCK